MKLLGFDDTELRKQKWIRQLDKKSVLIVTQKIVRVVDERISKLNAIILRTL